MSKFSVKKPLTVFVAVCLVILIGILSFTRMPTDLLPSMDLPYVVAITAYPGASPEKVELTVTKPLEKVLSTTSGLEGVTSVSSENSSMIILQFVQGTNMDSAMLDLSAKLDLVRGNLDDAVGSPTLMRMNPDMLPVMVASVDMDGKSAAEASKIVTEEVLPAFERIAGVASVSTTGLIEKQLKITLNQTKIDALNETILASVDSKLAETQQQLEEAQAKLEEARKKFEEESANQNKNLAEGAAKLQSGRDQIQQGLSALTSAKMEAQSKKAQLEGLKATVERFLAQIQAGQTQTVEQLRELIAGLQEAGQLTPEQAQALLGQLADGNSGSVTAAFESMRSQLEEGLQALVQGLQAMEDQQKDLNQKLLQLNQTEATLEEGKLTLSQQLSKAERQLSEQEAALEQGKKELENAKESAYQQAGLAGKITTGNLKSILTAQNFSMPAGSLLEEEQTYSIKIGDAFSSVEELENLTLFALHTGDLDTVSLKDVADVSFTDNTGEVYAKINGNDGILLSFQKQSTASTSQVSSRIRETMAKLESSNEGMHLTALNDQGVYIDIVINSVLQNLLMGGGLAIVILFLFLRNAKPTLIIAASIPISLLFALVLMYFSGVTLNIISLAGLALGVGMLVDNSIVVIENIYRMRSEGEPVLLAAVRGAKQVAGAIAASTLTTVCVFLPIVFTEGISRELFSDMGLTIAYSLVASLIVALTLVPALSSRLLRKPDTTTHKWFDRFISLYGRVLSLALRRKAVVLSLALLLLALSVFGVFKMGTAFMPETDSTQISVTMTMPKGSSDKDTRAMSDAVMERIGQVPGVRTVGAMQGGGMMGGGSGAVNMYVILEENRSQSSNQIAQQISDLSGQFECEVEASGSTGDMSALGGDGVQVDIRGSDLDTLRSIASDVAELVKGVEGTRNVSSGLEEASMETHITVDKNKATEYGLTVAQVYQAVAAAIQTESQATTVTLDDGDYPVIVAQDAESIPTREKLGDLLLTGTKGGKETEVALSELASIREQEGLASIRHDNQTRMLSVRAEVDSSHNIGLVGRDLQAKLDSYQVPEGYSVAIAGENETINETLSQLVNMVLLAIVLIYGIMVAQFQSFLSPFIVMFTIPLAFTGGLLALWIFGFELSIVSMLGFLVLAGIVVNNGIVFVDYVNQLRAAGIEKRDALVLAGKTRIRPILMTALTTILGLSTLALGLGMGADMLQPMAVVTIGGLAYATLLTLFVVPALYDVFHRRPMKVVDLGEDVL